MLAKLGKFYWRDFLFLRRNVWRQTILSHPTNGDVILLLSAHKATTFTFLVQTWRPPKFDTVRVAKSLGKVHIIEYYMAKTYYRMVHYCKITESAKYILSAYPRGLAHTNKHSDASISMCTNNE